jgi:hypothetical protein
VTAPARTSPPASFVEFFTLSRATAEGERLGATRRKEVSDALAVGRQRAEAAETLWSNGHTAEGLRLALVSLDDTIEAADRLAEPGPPTALEPAKTVEASPSSEIPTDAPATETPATDASETVAEPARVEPTPAETAPSTNERWRAVLASRGVRPARIESAAQTLAAARDAKLPKLDAEVSPALSELFPRVMAARQLVDGTIAPSAWSPGDIRWTRIRRTSGVALGLVAGIVALYFGLHEPEGTFTSASDVWAQSPSFGTDMAIDGRPETAWLLSDRTTGWLEVRTSPARRVERVILTNTSNAPAHDRGTQDYRLEIYAHGELARSIQGHFDWVDSPEPVTHEIGMDAVDRVRFVVTSFHRSGGGLAEMDIQ